MTISKTKIKNRTSNKTNMALQETIQLALKNKAWHKLAQVLSASTRRFASVNLSDIDKHSKQGETIVVPGKVLSSGNLTKKVKISALGISETAKEKLKETKSEFILISHEIKSNPKAEGAKLLR